MCILTFQVDYITKAWAIVYYLRIGSREPHDGDSDSSTLFIYKPNAGRGIGRRRKTLEYEKDSSPKPDGRRA
ncbi:MAG: hypothetical protein LBN29_13435, partial [Mediterranea sp.]|nr:hypothetical protein [Mediterranea sp.]